MSLDDSSSESDTCVSYHESGDSDFSHCSNVENNNPSKLVDSDVLKIEDFVLVKFMGKSSSEIFYVGVIVQAYNFSDFGVKFLRKNGNYFVFPLIDDISQISRKDIFAIIPKPNEIAGTSRAASRFVFNTDFSKFNVR